MQAYIALLRGINVSGSKKIKMAELREHLVELDIVNVQTYIQSGNIIFEYDEGASVLLQKNIREKILEKYGFDVSTQVKTVQEIEEVLEKNPFVNDPEKDIKRIFITFLSEKPGREAVEKLKTFAQPPEEIQFDGITVYFYSPGNYARAKLNNNFLEARLKQEATTRNVKTLRKLLEMGSEREL